MQQVQSPFLLMYPMKGLQFFLRTPALWKWLLFFALTALCIQVGTGYTIVHFTWPSETVESGKIWYVWRVISTLTLVLLSQVIIIIFIFPLMQAFFFEKLLQHVLLLKGVLINSEKLVDALKSTSYVFVKTLKWRVLFLLALILSFFITGPLSLLVSALGMSYLTLVDGCDLTLSLYGLSGKKRWQWIVQHRNKLWSGAVSGAGLSLILGSLLIGWILWLPCMFVSTALWIYDCSDCGVEPL